MKSNMDELYTRNFAMAKAAEDETLATRHDPSCAYEIELPEKWDREPEPFPLPEDIRFHRTQDMHVLRASDGTAIAYFPVRADAELRMLADEFVDVVKATVTVR